MLRALACLLAVVVISACGANEVTSPEDAATASEDAATARPPFVVPDAPAPAPVTERCAPAPPAPVIVDPATLPLPQQAALVLATGIPHAVTADHPEARAAAELGVGAVILKRENIQSHVQVRTLAESLSAASPLGLLFLVDHEGGRVSHANAVVPATLSARRLGHAAVEEATAAGETIGAALRAAGIHVALSPVADLDGGPWHDIIGDRSFGDDPEVAARTTVAYLQGLHARGTLGVAKHFPGYADADDTHRRPAILDLDLDDLAPHLRPFRALVDHGVAAIMVNHVTYTAFGDQPASVEPAMYDLLRSLGFDGVAITDSLGMGPAQRQGGHAGAAVAALAAGADLLLANQGSDAAVAMRDAIVAAVESGEIPHERLLEAADRVMRLRIHQAEVAAACR